MTLFFGIIGALGWLIFSAYEEMSGKRYSFHDENRMMYMTAFIITGALAMLALCVFVAIGSWGGVAFCLFIICFCVLCAYMLYDRVQKGRGKRG